MKNKKMLKKIISLLLFVIMIYLFVYLGTKNYTEEVADNIKFANEYKNISKNNVFSYAKGNEVLEILNKKSGIIFMSFSDNKWSNYYAELLNEVVIAHDIKKEYNYDFKADREIKNNTYLKIVEKLKDYLYVTDTDTNNLYAPSILIVKNGNIIYYDDEVSRIKGSITPDEYFTDYKKNLFMASISNVLSDYNEGE